MGVPYGRRGRVLPMPLPRGAPGLGTEMDKMAEVLASDAAQAVNELFVGSGVASKLSSAFDSVTSCHSSFLSQATRMAESFDQSISGKAAFESIGGGSDYLGEPTSFQPLDEPKLSLSEGTAEPRSLKGLLGPNGSEDVENFTSSCLSPTLDGEEACRAAGLSRPFMDPGIRAARRRYHGVRRSAQHSPEGGYWDRQQLGRGPLGRSNRRTDERDRSTTSGPSATGGGRRARVPPERDRPRSQQPADKPDARR